LAPTISDVSEDQTERGRRLGADDNARGGPLRTRIARQAFDCAAWLAERPGAETDDTTPALLAFLREPSVSTCLQHWFGADDPAAWRGEPKRLKAALDRDIAAIDALLSDQVNQIIHHTRFQTLEATWRGVDYLVQASDGVSHVKLRILAASWGEVVRDLERAADFDQSELFDKIYSQEFGMPGGEPFGLIVGDYALSHRRTAQHPTDDVAALKALAAVAAAAFVPFIAGCDPSLFGLESFREFTSAIDLDSVFQQAEYTRWRGLRAVEDGRFIGLCLPKILLRRPWWDDPMRRAIFRFHEAREQVADNGYLWGNAGFAFAAVAIRAFAQSGWFAEMRGARRGEIAAGLVPDLPTDHFTTDRPDIAFKATVDVAIPDRHERLLSDSGFIALSVAEFTPYAVFYGNQSLLQPQRFTNAVATINARLSAMLQYILCIGRFAHAIKVIGRDRVGSFSTAEECQTLIQNWLTEYVTANPNASLDLRTRYPLREGRVNVTELPWRPGAFKTERYLRPHLQLDDISTGIRLTTELAGRRAA
jgi:type VI secretion system protein ImpD